MNSIQSLKENSHSHIFDKENPVAKKNTLYATIFTFLMMIIEIIGGYYYNSMALLADGWHMSSHVLALGLAFVAYTMANKYANDFRFNFGTYKIEVLGGYTSALLLLVVAFFMVVSSVERILNPTQILYKEAITVAIIGLIVNIICAWLLKDDHHHHHGHEHSHEHHHHHEDSHKHEHHHEHDMNLKAAYIHVLADALTSVLAIIALVCGMYLGLSWLDPVMGIIGSILVFVWAINLIKQSGKILLDAQMDAPIVEEIIEVINNLKTKVTLLDLHVWQVGKGKYSCIISLESNYDVDINHIKDELKIHEELVHTSIEIHKKNIQ